ncbi:MAG: replicative DNA helicase [Spirochaetia bacterium]
MRNEHEDRLLGALLIDSAFLDAGRVSVDLFQNTDAQEVFRTMTALREVGRPVNLETVSVEVGSRVRQSYLAELSSMPTAANAQFYLDHLIETAQKREINRLALWLADVSRNGKTSGEILDSLETQLAGIRRKIVDTGDVDVHATMHELIDIVEQRIKDKADGPSGVPTGFHELDILLGGLQPGAVYILAARTSVGKTALALSIADYQVRAGIPVGFATMEMSALQLVERLVSIRSSVPVGRMKYGALRDGDMGAILKAAGSYTAGLRILDKPGLTLRGLKAWGHGAVGKGDRALYVDYLGLLDVSNDDRPRWEAMGQVSRTIKNLARELRVPVVALVQLNRLAASEGEPELHHLRDSGAFEQDADVVLLLHRTEPKETDGSRMHAHLRVAKNRSGPTGRVTLLFDRPTTHFADWQE